LQDQQQLHEQKNQPSENMATIPLHCELTIEQDTFSWKMAFVEIPPLQCSPIEKIHIQAIRDYDSGGRPSLLMEHQNTAIALRISGDRCLPKDTAHE
jgi:hypothetical protein